MKDDLGRRVVLVVHRARHTQNAGGVADNWIAAQRRCDLLVQPLDRHKVGRLREEPVCVSVVVGAAQHLDRRLQRELRECKDRLGRVAVDPHRPTAGDRVTPARASRPGKHANVDVAGVPSIDCPVRRSADVACADELLDGRRVGVYAPKVDELTLRGVGEHGGEHGGGSTLHDDTWVVVAAMSAAIATSCALAIRVARWSLL